MFHHSSQKSAMFRQVLFWGLDNDLVNNNNNTKSFCLLKPILRQKQAEKYLVHQWIHGKMRSPIQIIILKRTLGEQTLPLVYTHTGGDSRMRVGRGPPQWDLFMKEVKILMIFFPVPGGQPGVSGLCWALRHRGSSYLGMRCWDAQRWLVLSPWQAGLRS